nr:unnamed protein product [Callosobruchus chinensis]
MTTMSKFFFQAAEKLKVSLYYETLCPGCVEFVQKQLLPVYNEFEDYLQLDIVPFGNADYEKVGKKWKFTCQHGPDECYGNVIHACVCAKKAGIKFEEIKHCSKTRGDEIQLANAKKSKSVGYRWVPFVTFNDKFDEDVSMKATDNFKEFVCKHFPDNPPKGCLPPQKAQISVCRA